MIAPSFPDEGILGIGKPRGDSAIVIVKPPTAADIPADSPSESMRNANTANGGNGGARMTFPLLNYRLLSFGIPNRTPELPNPKACIYLPRNL